ncbi:hypothetical protein L1049_008724 [Liquidambar formosana]|uniref:Uncharacterized protein n=1 Tax=Liquidambar formosana TaxID=63359 RepID=A0AAP0SB67_LIQFO
MPNYDKKKKKKKKSSATEQPKKEKEQCEPYIPSPQLRKAYSCHCLKKMCPLRFILVFFSALVAGYFAWRTVRSSQETEDMSFEDSTIEKISPKDKQEFNLKRIIQEGFWVFVDMASGRYLWRNLREIRKDEKVKSC